MDVFKTKPGRAERIMISERSFIAATNADKPYRRTTGNGTSYFAVCPACDNPILLVGLFKSEQESRGRKPYGRHYRGDVPGLCRYDEEAYLHCPLADPNHQPKERKRKPSNPTGVALYRIMRTQFDRAIKAWETYSGIHMSEAYAERMIGLWRRDEGWRYYDTTYRNLPQSLFRAAGAQNLVGRYLIADSWISGCIGRLPGIRLESKPGGYRQVRKTGDGFMKLDFVLYDRELRSQGEHVEESYTMRIVQNNRPVTPETSLITDPDWLDHMKAFDHGHRNRRLLDIADRILG